MLLRLLLAGLLSLTLLALTVRAADDDVFQRQQVLWQQYRQKLEELAAWCDQHDLGKEAAQTREWAALLRDDLRRLVILCEPETLTPMPGETTPAAFSREQAEYWQRMANLRRKAAEAFFALAQTAIQDEQVALAFELIAQALRENPDHEDARELLGYRRYRDQWHTAWEIRKLVGGYVNHEKFGWIPSSQVDRYKAGQRLYRRRWIDAEQEARLRSDIRQGWQVETEHYRVITNHSLEAGVRLSRELERLYLAWQQTFPLYLASADEWAKAFRGRSLRRSAQPLEVVYYRTRDEYNEALRASQPQIEITTGIYFGDTRQAYFFAGGEHSQTTLYHEATHQLFHQRPVPAGIGREANFWAIEAVACYMESLTLRDGEYTLGGWDLPRMRDAWSWYHDDQFYLPLAELTELGMLELQRHPNIQAVYSQSAGTAHFLMHAADGRLRDPCMKLLLAIYSGRDGAETLAQVTGTKYEQLDRQYQAYLASRPE